MNNIAQLTLANGEICTDQRVIKESILKYYEDFLGTKRPRKGVFDNSEFQSITVPNEDCKSLCKKVTEKEVKKCIMEY